MWLIDKSFEFTAHHDLETCKALLLELRTPEKRKRWYGVPRPVVRVALVDEGRTTTFTISRRDESRVASKGTLEEGPDATVIVTGYARMAWGWAVFYLIAILVGILSIITNPQDVPIIGFQVIWVILMTSLFRAELMERKELEASIVAVLTDRGKVKKK